MPGVTMTSKSEGHVSFLAKSREQHLGTTQAPSPLPEIKKDSISLNQVIDLDPDLIDEWELVDRPVEEFGDLSELMNSIAHHGQSIPILVRQASAGRFELIYGRRRLKICKDLGIQVKAFVRDLNDQDAYQQMVIENEHRQDISSWAKALSYKKVLDRGIFPSQASLAIHLGIDRSALTNILVYTRIPEPVSQAIGTFSKVGIHTARALLSLSEDKNNYEPLIALAPKIASGEMGAKKLVRAVAKARNPYTRNTGSAVFNETGSKIFSLRRTPKRAVQILFPSDVVSRFSEDELKQRLASALM